MNDAVNRTCPECGRRVDIYDRTLVKAVEVHDLPGPGQEPGPANGNKRLFHDECFPAAGPRWKRVG